MSVCSAARDAVYDLRYQRKGSSKLFYPVDRLRHYFTYDKVREILACTCSSCREDLQMFDNGTEPTAYVERIRGDPDSSDFRKNFYSVFGLLVYIEHPFFVVGFVNHGCNDLLLERWTAFPLLIHNELQRYTGDFKQGSRKYERFAKRFLESLFQFSLPHLEINGFSNYNERTVLPFKEEVQIGRWLMNSSGRVFAFKIYQEYNFPCYRSDTEYVRKCISTPTPRAFFERSNIQYVQQLQNKHIVKLIKVYGHGDSINFVMPRAWTNLGHLLRDWDLEYDSKRGVRLEDSDAWTQLLGIASALENMHKFRDHDKSYAKGSIESYTCIHWDLKPENILVDWDGNWLITDFGQATLIEDQQSGTHHVSDHFSTDPYAPPEIQDASITLGRAYDIWSLGCIMLEVVSFLIFGHAGLNGTSTFEGLDEARTSMTAWSGVFDGRFWYQESPNGDYVVKEKVQAFKNKLQVRFALMNSVTSKLLLATIGLIDNMLQPTAKKRTDISRVVVTLSSALARARTQYTVEIAPNEVTLGSVKVNKRIPLDRSSTRSTTMSSNLEILQHDDGLMRLRCSAPGYPRTISSFRWRDAKIVPMYAFWDRGRIMEARAWIGFLQLNSSYCVKVPDSEYSFDGNTGLEQVQLIQSVVTSQKIVDSFNLTNLELRKPFSVGRAMSRLFRVRKADTKKAVNPNEPPSNLGPATVQLWAEQALPSPKGTNRPMSSTYIPMRRTENNSPLVPPCRVAIYLQELRFICTIKMDTNWVIEESTSDNRVLSFISLGAGRDKTFHASWLRPTPHELNDEENYPAGIPLDPSVLHAYEDLDSFEVENFRLTFLNNEDRDAFKWKYLETKKAWDLRRREINDTIEVNRAPRSRQQLPTGVVDGPVAARRVPFSVNTSVDKDLVIPVNTSTSGSTHSLASEDVSTQILDFPAARPQQRVYQEGRLDISFKEGLPLSDAEDSMRSNRQKSWFVRERVLQGWKNEEVKSDREQATSAPEIEAIADKAQFCNAIEPLQPLEIQAAEEFDHPDKERNVSSVLQDPNVAKRLASDDDSNSQIPLLQNSESASPLLHVHSPSEQVDCAMTLDVSEDGTKESLTLIEDSTKEASTLVEDGVETIYSLDGLDTGPKSQRIQTFVSQLIQDVTQDFSSYVKDIEPSNLVDIVRTFARRLYEESTDPFQWETSVVLHQKQWEIVRLLASIDIPSTNEVVLEHEEEEEDHPEENRTPFQKSSLDIQSWVVEVHNGSEQPPERYSEFPVPDTKPESAIQSEPQKDDPNDSIIFDESMSILEAEKKDFRQSVAYKEFISRSDAYRWLVASLHQSPGQLSGDIESMVAIRAYVRDQLRQQQPLRTLSRQRPPAMIDLTVKLEWNPIQIALSYGFKYPFSGILDDLYCLTGSETEAQVTTVVEYVTQMWPSTGTALITLMRELVSRPEGDVCSYQFSKPAKAKLTAIFHRPNQCLITITGGPYLVSEVVEQLAWLYSAIQMAPVSKGIVACIPKVGDFTTRPSTKIVSGVAVIADCRLILEFRDSNSIQLGQPTSQIPLRLKPFLIHGFPTLRSVEMMQEDATGPNMVLEVPSRMNSVSLQAMRLQLPRPLRQVVETTPKRLIEAHPRNDESILNKGKLWLEDYTGFLLDWRPLKNPRENIPPGMWRVEWAMFGHRLQMSTTEENALLLKDLLSVVEEHPDFCDCCIPKAPPLSLMDIIDLIGNTLTSYAQSCMGIVSHAKQASSSAADKYTPGYTSPSGATNSQTTLHLRSQKNTAPVPPQPTIPPATIASIIPPASIQQNCHQVLFAVKGSRWSWELEPVAMTNAICDSTFFRSLRKHHRDHRHAYLHWISPFRFKNCRCVKLEVVEPQRVLAGTQQALPDDYGQTSSYEYAPRPPDVKIPLIDPRHYLILLSECPPTCLWRLWPTHECIHLSASNSHRLKIPRRKDDIKDLLDAGEGVAFGIEADYVLSLRILAAYHLAAIVPAFIFWALWLSKHEGDWQNASVPLLTVLALTTVFWIMAGKRVGIS